MMMTLAMAVLLGAVAWSFAEYALHSWWGHLARGRTDFSREHLAHHRDTTYFAPTWKKLIAAGASMTALAIAAVAIAGLAPGLAFLGGFFAAYVGYEVLHRRIHTHGPWNPYARWARRHHLSHHFGGIRGNYGVTSPLWDILLGTWVAPGVVPIPPRQRVGVPWLFDDDGAIKGGFAADYTLGRRSVADPGGPTG